MTSLLILSSMIAASWINSSSAASGADSANPAIPWKGNAAFPSAEQAKTIGLTKDQLLHLGGVFDFDVKNAKRFDMALDKITASSSEQLVRHFVFSPMRVTFSLYDDRNLGITRSVRSSATLSALLSRKDVVDGILRFYGKTPVRGSMARKEAAEVSLALMAADQILMYPLVFERIDGQEARVLRSLCDRYRIMQAANEARKADDPLYGATFITTYQLATMLEKKLRQMTPGAAPPAQRSREQEQNFFKRCEKLLNEYEDKRKDGSSR